LSEDIGTRSDKIAGKCTGGTTTTVSSPEYRTIISSTPSYNISISISRTYIIIIHHHRIFFFFYFYVKIIIILSSSSIIIIIIIIIIYDISPAPFSSVERYQIFRFQFSERGSTTLIINLIITLELSPSTSSSTTKQIFECININNGARKDLFV